MSKLEVNAIDSVGTTLTLGDTNATTLALNSGITTLPSTLTNTPAFSAYVGSNRGPFSSATWTDIPFTNERFDTDSAFNGTTFTVPETGKYLFTAQLRVEQLSLNMYYQMRLTTETTTIATIGTDGFDTNVPYFMLSACIISSQNSGESVKVQLYQSGTATSYVHTESYFCGMKLIGA